MNAPSTSKPAAGVFEDACVDLRPRTLADLDPQQVAKVVRVDADDADNDPAARQDVERLKAMGLCEGRSLQVIKPGDPLIVRVLGSRVGLSARLASRIHVQCCQSAPRP